MSDIFISYARSTARQARQVAEALRALGYSVWIDDELPAHRTYSHVIEQQLDAAKAAVVLWSADAATSEWVLSEANRAREDRKLVQVVIDKVRLPMPFDQIQCTELAGWNGNAEAPGWRKIIASIAELTAGVRSCAGPPAGAAPEPRVAVLAFDNLSGNPDLLYFSDGVSEEIQQTLARTAGLKVIGRGSSFQFRGADKAAAHVASALGATHVLDGSVRRSGQKVRIATQLVECATETTLWSDRFDRDLADIFAVQDEIAAAVAAALQVAFAPRGPAPQVDPAAYNLYLRARSASLAEQIGLFEQAIARAPDFAQAWASLAASRAFRLRFEARTEPYEGLRVAVVLAAETAIRLDPAAGAAFQALSWLEPFGRYGAREALELRALAAAPHDPIVLSRAGFFAAEVGRIHEALGFARQALDIDPLSLGAGNNYACSLEAEGQYTQACEVWDTILARWPGHSDLVGNAIAGAGVRGDLARIDAIAATLRALGLATDEIEQEVRDWRSVAGADATVGRVQLERAREQLARTGSVIVASLSTICRLGLAAEAFELVESASFDFMFDPAAAWPPEGTSGVSVIFNLGHSRALMEDPRFPRLCARLGLCAYWVESGRWPDCARDGALPYDFKAEVRRLARPASA